MNELEPESAALVRQLTAGGGALLEEADIGALRTRMAQMVRVCAPQPLPVGAAERQRLPFAGRNVEVVVYRPPAPRPAAPALLYFHGGAYTHLSAETHDPVARYLCNRSGAVVIIVDYRLAPEHKFPAPIEDAYDALCWVFANARELGIDPGQVSGAGDSAGGTIAIALCLEAAARGGPPINTQIALCPSLTLNDLDQYASWRTMGDGRYLLSRAAIEEIRSVYLRNDEDRLDPRVSPILARDVTGLPAALIITAEFDPLVDEAAHYANRLMAAGVPVSYRCFPGTIHAFMILAGVISLGYEALDVVARWIRK